MYVAAPPGESGNTGHGGALPHVRRIARRVFEGASESASHPDLRVYLADLTRQYGVALRDDLLASGSGHCYGEMGAALIAQAVPDGQPVHLLVLAFSVPDVRPERSTASYLSHLCPGDPMAFAVCDQGAAAAFTGLRLVAEYLRSGECERALLLVLEQAALHHDLAAPAATPVRHAAVAVLCDRTGPSRVHAVRQHADVTPAQVPALLAGEIADLSAGRAGVTIVAGHGLARMRGRGERSPAMGSCIPAGSQVRAAPAGQPFTGAWWELAGIWAGPPAGAQHVLLADYDHDLGYLSVLAVGLPAKGSR